ncbi:hypothetical protein BTVI_03882 [Pitangus sulphuratus]|nr:hypothetical protein BTVI_03882 [Pitangus sulphuratus]
MEETRQLDDDGRFSKCDMEIKIKTGVTVNVFNESTLAFEVTYGPKGDVNVANALVSLQETAEFMAKTVNVMIDSVKMQKEMSVGHIKIQSSSKYNPKTAENPVV